MQTVCPSKVMMLVDDAAPRPSVEAWREALAPLGLELVVAHPPAEALRLFGRRLPGWVVLSPACGQGRGRTLYAELRRHPYAARTRFVLLGEALPGHDGPVWPVPAEPRELCEQVEGLLRAGKQPASMQPGDGPSGGGDATERGAASSPAVARARDAGAGEAPPVVPLPPTLGPGAGEETGDAFCRRLLRWAGEPEALRLTVADGAESVRTLWIAGGRLVAAVSSVPSESLLERARQDGLVSAAELGELQPLRRAGNAEQLAALRARGWVRAEEAPLLLRRQHHALALAALASPSVRYTRSVAAGAPAGEAADGEGPAVGAVVVEALRRRAEPAGWLQRVGGRQARVRPLPHAVELEALGLTERELAWARGWGGTGGTVERLLLGAGVRESAALSLLQALEALEILAVEPPDRPAPAVLGEREVVRLQAKLGELERADYFEVLGIGSDAGAPEVLRAWEQLRAEFEPLRYVGHPDTGLVHDAQRVCAALDEAARALRDDALRAAYARHRVG